MRGDWYERKSKWSKESDFQDEQKDESENDDSRDEERSPQWCPLFEFPPVYLLLVSPVLFGIAPKLLLGGVVNGSMASAGHVDSSFA